MTLDGIVELFRHAILLALVVSLPLLASALLLGVVISMFQAVTQIQEQTLTFVPKLVALALLGAILLPWTLRQLIQHMASILTALPSAAG